MSTVQKRQISIKPSLVETESGRFYVSTIHGLSIEEGYHPPTGTARTLARSIALALDRAADEALHLPEEDVTSIVVSYGYEPVETPYGPFLAVPLPHFFVGDRGGAPIVVYARSERRLLRLLLLALAEEARKRM